MINTQAETGITSQGVVANGALTDVFSRMYGDDIIKHRLAQRQAGKVYVTGHRIGGGPMHMAIEYTDSDGEYITLSAGAEKGLLVSHAGGRYSGRSSDAPSNNFTIGVVNPPEGITSAQYARNLINADANYKDNLDYDLFPGIQDSYNSNSYVRGLIEATGGSTSVDFGRYYGGNDPVPSCNFSYTGC